MSRITTFFLTALVLQQAAFGQKNLNIEINKCLSEEKLAGAVWAVVDSSGEV